MALRGGGGGTTGNFLAEVDQLDEAEAIAQGYTIIKTADELQNMSSHGKYIMMNDINLSGYDWNPINAETIELNGNGHVIRNLHVDCKGDDNGFFSNLQGSSIIQNVGFENAYVRGNHAGILCGSDNNSYNSNKIKNIYCTGFVEGGSAGGIIGEVRYSRNGVMENVYADIEIGNGSHYGYPIFGDYFEASYNFSNVYYNSDKVARGSEGQGLSTAELNSLIVYPKETDTALKINFQVGINSDESSQINLKIDTNIGNVYFNLSNPNSARAALTDIDNTLQNISSLQTKFGAAQNRLESAAESISVNIENLTSTRSTLRDADVAEESSAYIKNQILQQAAATLLATANQTPAIALQLI